MVWGKIKAGWDRTEPLRSAATAGLSGKLLMFLLIFIFANIGYVTGFPLIIYAWFAHGVGVVVNFFLSLLSLPIIPEFMFTYSKIITKFGWGFIFNGLFVWWFINRRRAIKAGAAVPGFWSSTFRTIIKFAWIWVVFSFVFTVFYTGYNFGLDLEFPVTGCGIQQTVQSQIGIAPVSCEIEELELRVERAGRRAEFEAETGTGLFGGIFGAMATDAGGGTVFKSQDVSDSSVNSDAGSSLTNLRSARRKFTSYSGTAEDIKFLANLEVKSLFLSNIGDSKVRIFINPQIDADLVCRPCTFLTSQRGICLVDEINDPFDAFELGANGQAKTKTYNVDNIEDWCVSPWNCNVQGAEPLDKNEFLISSGFNQEIECVHSGLSLKKDEFVTYDDDGEVKSIKFNGLGKPIPIDVDFSYDGRALGTKQFFIVDRNILRQAEDPIQSLGLSEFVISKSYNDGRVSLGLGTESSYDFIEPTYEDDFSMDITDVGLSFNMRRAGGYNTKINSAMLWVQVIDDSIEFICSPPTGDPVLPKKGSSGWSISRSCKKGDWAGNFIYDGEEEGYHKFKLNEERADTDMKAGEVVNYYVNLFVPDAALGGSNYQGILVESEINYTYTTREDLMIRITHDDYYGE